MSFPAQALPWLAAISPQFRARPFHGAFEDTRCTSGHVVLDGSHSPIKGANVEVHGIGMDKLPAETDAYGAFQVTGGPRCVQTNASSNLGIDYLRISTPSGGVAHVDPCANAPWSDPIRLRPGASLVGKFEGAGAAHWVNAVVLASEVDWPPQSGLASTDESWRVFTDADGVFRFTALPAQVPVVLSFDPALVPDGISTDIRLVLKPEVETRIDPIEALSAPPGFVHPVTVDAGAPWKSVRPEGVDADRRPRSQDWFQFVEGGRWMQHRVGGGRFHVHQWRACNHLEIQPGQRTLVGRDADGWFGFEVLDVKDDQSPIVRLAPGALVVTRRFEHPPPRRQAS